MCTRLYKFHGWQVPIKRTVHSLYLWVRWEKLQIPKRAGYKTEKKSRLVILVDGEGRWGLYVRSSHRGHLHKYKMVHKRKPERKVNTDNSLD